MNSAIASHAARLLVAALLLVAAASFAAAGISTDAPEPWQFAVSGDSRNYGDLIMPAIAASVLAHSSKFYWHLGDFRIGYAVDEDIKNRRDNAGKQISTADYLDLMWPDFLEHQIKPFGTLPVFLGIGNHDVVPPKTRDDFLTQFAAYLDTPELRAQRLKDDKHDRAWKAYFHWIIGSVDFINLDNASSDQFDDAQVHWFEEVLYQDTQGSRRSTVKSIVVGMHRALPDSRSAGHSMNESPQGIWSGRRVYRDLVAARDESQKNVYILASHSHFYLEDVYDTDCWNGSVLPGWIVGTAGAQHYPLPDGIAVSPGAMSKVNGSFVYGYLLGTVAPDSKVTFTFQRVSLDDVRKASSALYDDDVIKKAFSENYTDKVDVHQARCPAP